MTSSLDRRAFLRTSAVVSAGLASLTRPTFSIGREKTLRVLSIGVVGTIGQRDRTEVSQHPFAQIVGLCDVDANALARAAKEVPDAFTCRDYRVAFAEHADAFDAVIVSTPDHTHAPILMTALAHDKHVYGQKPLVHQLEELALVDRAVRSKPHLKTQLGNQRAAYPGRRAAVQILREARLGPAIEAYAWTSAPNRGRYFNFDHILHEPEAPPEHLDWNLWLGPCAEVPYRKELAPIQWRSWWNHGSNGLGDWGCHLLDAILLSYDELDSPSSVQTHCVAATDEHFHPHPCRATLTYRVRSDRFARSVFPIHFTDTAQAPSRTALGLPAGPWPDRNNCTVVVCEQGVLVLSPSGDLEIWRNGVRTQGLAMPHLPSFPPMNHWHSWVDACLGRPANVLTPFLDGVRITEPALLAVKATRFPGTELHWNRATLSFDGHEEATKTIVRRTYREGFAPPVVS